MATLSREQLVKYVKTLEKKVKQYQEVLKIRDQKIAGLKQRLDRLTVAESEQPVNALETAPPPPEERKAAPLHQKLKAKPLEERPKTFVKKAPAGVEDWLRGQDEKESVDTEEPSKVEESEQDEKVAKQAEETEETPAEEAAPVPMPSVNFEAGEFLSAVLEGEEDADLVKTRLEELETAEKDQRRNVLLKLTDLHWKMFKKMAKRMARENLTWEKRLFLRYGMLDEKLMSDRMEVWQQLYLDKSKPEDTGLYFIDELCDEIARGNLKYSSIDEMSLDGRKPDPNASGEVALGYEIINIPQMQRMCVGARANTVSILVQEYCSPGRDNPIVNRKWLKPALDHVVNCDYLMFHRKQKGEEYDVQPIFIICPGYGQKAGCWEPWSPGQKRKTGPRICICAFPPRSSNKALILGISDFRWNWAKEDAMHYWLSEGLTGKWLALFSSKEQRKDLKAVFMDNYFHWVANESRCVPKMDKKFREFFWHNLPFGDEIKQGLKGSGLFGRLIEMEEAKKKREEEERIEIERIKAEREARKAARKAKLEG